MVFALFDAHLIEVLWKKFNGFWFSKNIGEKTKTFLLCIYHTLRNLVNLSDIATLLWILTYLLAGLSNVAKAELLTIYKMSALSNLSSTA